MAQNSSLLLVPKVAASLKLLNSTTSWCFYWFLAKNLQPNKFAKGPGALLAKIEYDGILRNLQVLMCKKHQITYRYFMFCWLNVKKSPRGLKKQHYHHGGKIWFWLVKNVNISRKLCSDWLKIWHSPWFFFIILHHNVMRICLCYHTGVQLWIL